MKSICCYRLLLECQPKNSVNFRFVLAFPLVPDFTLVSTQATVQECGWFPCLPVSLVRLLLFFFLYFHYSTLSGPYHILDFDNIFCFPSPQLFACRRNDTLFKVWDYKKKQLQKPSPCFVTLCLISMFFFSRSHSLKYLLVHFIIWYLFDFSWVDEMAYQKSHVCLVVG